MRVLRTRTTQLRRSRSVNNNARASEKYAVQFQLMFVQYLIGLYYTTSQYSFQETDYRDHRHRTQDCARL